jgi:hypothetical protein
MLSEDERFDLIRSKLDICLYGDQKYLSHEYWSLKSLTLEYCRLYSPKSENDFAANTCLCIIDLALLLDSDEINPTSSIELSRLLRLDEELKLYCQSQLLKNHRIPNGKLKIVADALAII